jgi:hypothetical protein
MLFLTPKLLGLAGALTVSAAAWAWKLCFRFLNAAEANWQRSKLPFSRRALSSIRNRGNFSRRAVPLPPRGLLTGSTSRSRS